MVQVRREYCHTDFVISKSISRVYGYNQGRNNAAIVSKYPLHEFMSRKLLHITDAMLIRRSMLRVIAINRYAPVSAGTIHFSCLTHGASTIFEGQMYTKTRISAEKGKQLLAHYSFHERQNAEIRYERTRIVG